MTMIGLHALPLQAASRPGRRRRGREAVARTSRWRRIQLAPRPHPYLLAVRTYVTSNRKRLHSQAATSIPAGHTYCMRPRRRIDRIHLVAIGPAGRPLVHGDVRPFFVQHVRTVVSTQSDRTTSAPACLPPENPYYIRTIYRQLRFSLANNVQRKNENGAYRHWHEHAPAGCMRVQPFHLHACPRSLEAARCLHCLRSTC